MDLLDFVIDLPHHSPEIVQQTMRIEFRDTALDPSQHKDRKHTTKQAGKDPDDHIACIDRFRRNCLCELTGYGIHDQPREHTIERTTLADARMI